MKELLQALVTLMVIGIVMVGAFIWRVEYLAYVQDQKQTAEHDIWCRTKADLTNEIDRFICGPPPPRAD